MLIGIDVAKAEVAVRPRRRTLERHQRSARGEDARGPPNARATCALVLEATGGYEMLGVASLAAAALPAVVVNPRQARAFAEATYQLAKTDRIDAELLALFAERVRPPARPIADADAQELDVLLTRRRQLLDMLQAERNRLGQVFGRGKLRVKKSLTQHITFLERELRGVGHFTLSPALNLAHGRQAV